MGHPRLGKASKQGTPTARESKVREPTTREEAQAQMWMNARWLERIGDRMSRMHRTRLALVGDPEKRERMRMVLIQVTAQSLSPEERARISDSIVNEMPRRLRRAIGMRGVTGYGFGSMAVPSRDAKRTRNISEARARGDE